MADAPLSADSHWSHAEPGQAFTFTLEYDSKIYTEPTTRVVRMRRNAETGFSFSEEPEWSYTAGKYSDNYYHVEKSARRQFEPDKKKQPKKQRTGGLHTFFADAPPKPPERPAAALPAELPAQGPIHRNIRWLPN